VVVAVDDAKLSPSFLGRSVDRTLMADLDAAGADICGEEGEYHTMVTMASLFARPVSCAWDGIEARDGHHVLRFVPAVL
jgi:diphthamide synthase (EF-2-diphthine--ammonia ligase)